MGKSTSHPTRIIARQAAYVLSEAEIDAVSGGGNCTYTYCPGGGDIMDAEGTDCENP